MTAYEQLESRFARMGAIGDAQGILHWDASVMMPPGGADARAEQIAALSTVRHEILAHPETVDLLDQAEGEAGLDPWRRANLREMRRGWIHEAAVPAKLVEARAKAAMKSEMDWRDARAANDFAATIKPLGEVLGLEREAAAAKAEALGCTPYDALLDQNSPGVTAAMVDRVFAELKDFLPGFMAEVIEAQASQPPPIMPEGPFPIDVQRKIGIHFMELLGFDFAQGRLDVSLHPFSGGTPDDLRITTRYDEGDFATGLMGVLHETGHALYERGLPAEWRRQPVGIARGMD
ncbi:MAG: carboxypeptidase M32, partial [Rhodospirillales bacterium]|nr:carboxypeptidase M32 [Rhodospirillales bacterium]